MYGKKWILPAETLLPLCFRIDTSAVVSIRVSDLSIDEVVIQFSEKYSSFKLLIFEVEELSRNNNMIEEFWREIHGKI